MAIRLRQFYRQVFRKRWRAFANVDRHIEDSAFATSHELALSARCALKMQAAQNSPFPRNDVIILNKARIYTLSRQDIRPERLREGAALIDMPGWHQQQHIRNA